MIDMSRAANGVFEYVPDPHGYWVGRESAPSPSSVFADLGLVDPRFYTESSRSRGKAVHAALHFAQKGTLDWDTVHPDLHGYVHSGMKLIALRKPTVIALETPLYHPGIRFAGTFDAEWEMENWRWIIDWKTGKAADVARYQTAAYEMLARYRDDSLSRTSSVRVRPYKRAAVELQEDGSTANLVRYEDHTDGAGWINLLGAFRIREAKRARQLATIE